MAAVAAEFGHQLQLDLVDRMPRGAFGYSPERWPTTRMFVTPISPLQVRMVTIKARLRGIALEELPMLRTLVLGGYGVGDGNSKGNAALFIDWLMNADDDSVDEALQAVAAPYEYEAERRSDRGAA